MHILDITTPFTLAAFSTAPTWSLILMVFIVIVLIVLMHRELWSFFTKVTTGVVLFVILAIFSILGGLLPQHYTQEEAAMELLNVLPPEGVSLQTASQQMGLPNPGEIPPLMLARQWELPDPAEITRHEAIEIMGEEPAKGVSVKDAYSGWLKREYNGLIIDVYGEWFEEKLLEGAEDFKEAYKLDLFIPFYNIGFFRIFHTWYFLLVTYLFFTTVICCSIKRLSGYFRTLPREPVAYPDERLKRQNEVEEFDFKKGELVDAKGAADILAAGGLKPRACKKETDGYQLALNFGFIFPHTLTSVILHLGIFIALLGFLTTSYYSWKDYVKFNKPGDTASINYVNPDIRMRKLLSDIHEKRGWAWADPEKYFDIEESFQLRCDEYFVEYITNDDDWYDIKDWKTRLVVVVDGEDVKEQLIEVNDPLVFEGIDFYQLDYGQQGVIEITAPDGRTSITYTGQGRMHTPGISELDQRLYCSGLVRGTLIEKGKEPAPVGPVVRLGEVLPPKVEHWPNPGGSVDKESTNPKAQEMILSHLEEHRIDLSVANNITADTLKYLETKGEEVSDLDAYIVVFNDLRERLETGPDDAAELAGVMLYLWREGDDVHMGEGMKGMPGFNWLVLLKDGEPVSWNGYTFKLRKPYSAMTGIEVRRDPGVTMLWISVIIVMVMMVLRVYFPRYTARVDITPTRTGGANLIVAGRAYGLGANFRKRAERIAKILKAK